MLNLANYHLVISHYRELNLTVHLWILAINLYNTLKTFRFIWSTSSSAIIDISLCQHLFIACLFLTKFLLFMFFPITKK